MGYNTSQLNKQKLDEHVSLMEARFADHFGTIDDQLAELKESISDLPNLKSSIDQMQGKGGENSHKEHFRYTNGNFSPKLPKIEFPKFDGGDCYGWIRKAERHFEFNPMDDYVKVNFASVHFEAQSEYWFGIYIKARGRVLWLVFIRDLTARFAKLFKESVIGEFHKLRQVGTVEQYYNDFEALRSIMVNEGCRFDDNYFIHSFISGLRDEIRLEVEKFEVYELSQAIFLARKQEASLTNSWHMPRTSSRPTLTTIPFHSTPQKPPQPISLYIPKPVPTMPTHSHAPPSQPISKALLLTPSNPPYQKIPRTYFDDRKKKGLCYWYDDIFSPTHVCKNKQIAMLIVDEEEEMEEPPPKYDEEPSTQDNTPSAEQEKVEITDTTHIPQVAVTAPTLSSPYNDIADVELLFETNKGEITAVILEPVVGNSGFIAPKPDFLNALRKITNENGALLIFDEVMTGFRLSYGGAQEYFGITPDLTTLGKIIGGGLPVGAYGGRREIMEMVAPAGPMYQAGTLSGNPLAMTASIHTLKRLKEPGQYDYLDKITGELVQGILNAGKKAGHAVCGGYISGMFGFFFTKGPVFNFEDAKKSDTAKFARFFRGMLEEGVYFAPSQFEAGFTSLAHTSEDIQRTIAAAENVFKLL
ncbi:hypothetical protein RJ640_022248 [Escallonia rubra]|uniref:Ty3 transposon capsid-like protein domain-containing protein n=1 Tax=Escallonia rubra TaxID=112253 RepID=A0AA88QJC7_9ASTE|nr:hypothetical protein RJ640_022248 [Escallonia rubra]